MPELTEHFVLFRSEGVIRAAIIPSIPNAFTFEGQRFNPSKCFFIHFNCLVREDRILVGFQFPSAHEAGDPFLVSRFANDSVNARLQGVHRMDCTFAELDIWLGEEAGAESDTCLFLGTFIFESADREYIIVVPCDCQYWWSELGFKLASGALTPQAIV